MRQKYRVTINIKLRGYSTDFGEIARLYNAIADIVEPFARTHDCKHNDNLIYLTEEERVMLSMMLPEQYYLRRVLVNEKA